MKNQNDWKPELYLQFKDERTQPSIDLVNKIKIGFIPENIIDIGCGPGNSGQVLIKRWPSVRLIGIDNSASMIEKAKRDYPLQEWILADAAAYNSDIQFDIVFSNAALQWIPDQNKLLGKFYGMLSSSGLIAVQVPLFWDMPVGKAIKKAGKKIKIISSTNDIDNLFAEHDITFYYNIFSQLFGRVEIWQTDYFHIMNSQLSILEMLRSTGLKPYLERLKNEEDKIEFEKEILAEIKKDYPVQDNGKVLFPFKRLFLVGYK